MLQRFHIELTGLRWTLWFLTEDLSSNQRKTKLPQRIDSEKMLLVTADFDDEYASSPSFHLIIANFSVPPRNGRHSHGSRLQIQDSSSGMETIMSHSFALPDQAFTKITKAFLKTGVLPEAQDSYFVSVYAPGVTRKPIPDPHVFLTDALAGDVDSGNVTVEVPY
ncbi:hypothetical protein BDZ45DRAFT_746722 [Acephala macrosclerotiorum]|nr:hypothetical protein BDZ45DRAFT_746722 [Acephala macrosclerotiorum]